MRTLFRNISANHCAFDVKLLTIASIMHLKVQEEMPVIMKIDRIFNIKEIVKVFVDVAQISYKYRIACHYQREYLENSKNNIRKSSAIYDDECEIYNLYICL
jgi:hypothetical protein